MMEITPEIIVRVAVEAYTTKKLILADPAAYQAAGEIIRPYLLAWLHKQNTNMIKKSMEGMFKDG